MATQRPWVQLFLKAECKCPHVGPLVKKVCTMFIKYEWGVPGAVCALQHWLLLGRSKKLTQSEHIEEGKRMRDLMETHWAAQGAAAASSSG